MNMPGGKFKINPVSNQYNRWLRALDADYANVDDRSFNQMLDFSVKFGSLINFYNLEDQIEGDWVDFFQADSSMVIASIDAANIVNIEHDFQCLNRKLISAQTVQEKFDCLRDAVIFIVNLANQFNTWNLSLDKLNDFPASEILRADLKRRIQNTLSIQLNKLKSYAEAAEQKEVLNQSLGVDFGHFPQVWSLSKSHPDASIYSGGSITQKIENALASLTSILDAFIHGLGDLQHLIRFNMPDSGSFSRHRPQVALYMAFVELYRNAQNTINTFSERYIKFYYEDVLKGRQLAAKPDKVYLNFVLQADEDVYDASVPAGTLFTAGQNINGHDIVYSADKNLLVTAANIAELKSLRVEKAALVQQEKQADSRVVQGIFSSEIILDEKTKQSSMAWPTFGSNQQDKLTKLAVLGFAISSPYLLLTGGERFVTLELKYSQEYFDEILFPLLKEIQQITGLSEAYIFHTLLLDAFTIYASSSSGWFEIQHYCINFLCKEDKAFADLSMQDIHCGIGDVRDLQIFKELSFNVCFRLPASAPPISAFAIENAGEEPDCLHHCINPDLPTLNIYLRQQPVNIKGLQNNNVDVYPISLLGQMMLDAVQIHTQVKNLNNLTLANTDGEIDPSSPFLVFGGTPVVGSYLQIFHEELFSKTPSRMDVEIEWFNLPGNDTGFAGYYRYYDVGLDGKVTPNLFNNTRFKGEISIVNPGSWDIGKNKKNPSAAGESVYLFRTQTKDQCCPSPPADYKPLCKVTEFKDLNIQSLTRGFPPYYNPAGTVLQLMLTEPSYAFGNDIYAQNVLNAVIADLPDTDECKEKCLCDTRPIADVIQCLKSILEKCLIIADSDARLKCIEIKLAECELSLIASFIQCFLRCLMAHEDSTDVESLQKIKEKSNSLFSQHSRNRLYVMKWCLATLDMLNKSAEKPVKPSCGDCKNIYQTAVIFYEAMTCVSQCTDDVLSCQEKCLVSALEQAEALYNLSLTTCMDGCMTPDRALKYPNEPYLPQALAVHVNYRASCTVFDVGRTNNQDENSSDFYHLLPFAGYRQLDCSSKSALPMLPHYAKAGNLYIGFAALTVPQSLSILFQMNGSSRAGLPDVQWDLLIKNQWQNLPPIDQTSDSTNGLQNSGIVVLEITAIDNTDNTILNNQYTWLRASVIDQAGDFPYTQAIFPHAISASLVIADEYVQVDPVLPAYSITGSLEDLPNIAQINQPLKSFGGRSPETYPAFKMRMGERLRHKDRAIQSWDYERLVLQQFPDIWKVQALPAHNGIHANAPGNVLVVVVPGANCIDCTDPTIPAAPDELLQHIKRYLQKRVSPFLQLHISNPVYVRVRVQVLVSFYNSVDTGENIDRLNSDLVQYLSPWFYNIARTTRDGDYASEADIASFILNRPYVSAMTGIKYFYSPSVEELKTDWYFLTSAQKHDISISGKESCSIIEFGY